MILLVMGVSGSGKTTIGEALAAALRWEYVDADDYHPQENVAKMASGTPLTDADRWPWLKKINEEIRRRDRAGKSAVLGCSALKQAYRDELRSGIGEFRTVYLHGTPELLRSRIGERRHRFMPATLLDSQLATLEPPRDAIEVDVSQPVERCVEQVLLLLKKHP